MATKYGCPVYKSSPLTKFNKQLEFAIAVLMISLGGLLLWYGGRFPKLALEVLTTIIVGVVLIQLLYGYLLPNFLPSWSVYWACYLCFGMGLGLTIGTSRWPRVGVIVIGLTIGAIIGRFFNVVLI